MDEQPDIPVKPGDTLAGKYRVERVLGVGGMGVVVAATHVHLDQLVALKFMLPGVLNNATAVSRFLREAKAVVRLKGEHVARVLDVGTLDNDAPYIVMEFLEGEDLGAVLEQRGRLTGDEACRYVLQTCEAMAEAHAQDIIHRDLKPQNLFLAHRPDGTRFVKVLDFGISKTNLDDGNNAHATHTSAMMGSPAYMSPEQVQSSKTVDARTDIWALGVILYQLLTGRMPFSAPTMVELCVQIFHHTPPAPSAIQPDVVATFDAIVMRCLSKDREHRYGNIAELVADLARLAPRGDETLERVRRLLKLAPAIDEAAVSSGGSLGVAPIAFDTTLGGAAAESTSHAPRRSRWPIVAGAGVVIVAVAIGAAVAMRSSEPAPAPATATPTTQPVPARPTPAPPPDPKPVAVIPDAALPDAAAVVRSEPPAVRQETTAVTPTRRPRTAAPPSVPIAPPPVTPPTTEPVPAPKYDPYATRR